METFVVPRYLSFFGELLLEMVLAGEGARFAHLGCRTGYPDKQLYEINGGSTVVGVDPSAAALELARNKAAALGEVPIEYVEATDFPTGLEAQTFSHTVCLHPVGSTEARLDLYREMHRLLYPGGQALVALPLRGSFQEVADLLREYALKQDEGELGRVVEESIAARHTIETLSEELESVGLDDVDVEIRQTALAFDSGRAFIEDPVSRLLVLPEVKSYLPGHDLEKPLEYIRDAIDKYWSEGKFELTLNVGCASARRLE
ncbi:MAG: class I SAM-dependent methyltransferase [Polyangiaceae bacterium]|nr:class I SAM-dependent methyltransferase [Polyangiaceae bacterium]